jgi:hypothetical protein
VKDWALAWLSAVWHAIKVGAVYVSVFLLWIVFIAGSVEIANDLFAGDMSDGGAATWFAFTVSMGGTLTAVWLVNWLVPEERREERLRIDRDITGHAREMDRLRKAINAAERRAYQRGRRDEHEAWIEAQKKDQR